MGANEVVLESALMQRWAPLLKALQLSEEPSDALPGLTAFLPAANGLHQVLAVCNSSVEAARVGSLLHVCRANVVQITGSHVPGRFPTAMGTLHVCFSTECDNDEWDADMPSVLVHHLMHQHGLRGLCVDMADHCEFVLACPMQLPMLCLSVEFQLQADTHADLTWLQHQPCALSLTIHIMTSDREAHRALVEQLQPIPITMLELEYRMPVCADVQALWKQVTVKQSCCVRDVSSAFCFLANAVQALPNCPSVLFTAESSDSFSCKPIALWVAWSAVTDQRRTIRVQLPRGWVYAMMGQHSPPQGQPWQLCINAGCEVVGLPDGCRQSDGSWLYQDFAFAARTGD